MADGEIKINTKLDTTGLDKGIKDMQGKLDKAGKTIDEGSKKSKGLTTSLGGLSKGAIAAGAAVAGVAVAVKKTVDALNDCEAAYQKQRKAETALQVAARNNPYLNSESVYNLKQYASELQSMSEVGDEVSLQVMSQLAATGRTEEEIMQIMSAAADMAAVTGQDIGSAAQQLNATLNGVAGQLGRQVEAINNLTKEELQNGKAIEIVAAQYKGAASETADVTVQLSNAWGDFKENIGKGWNQVTQPVKQFFLDVLNNINEVKQKTADLKTADAAANAGEETAAQAKLRLDEAQAVLDQIEAQSKRATEILQQTDKEIKKSAEYINFTTYTDSANPLQDFKKQQQEIINTHDEQAKTVEELTRRYNFLAYAEEYAAEKAEKEAAATAAAADAAKKKADRDKEATDYINANQKALAQQIEAMELNAKLTGEEVDAGEMYNAYLQSYIDLVTKSNGLVTENNSAAKARLALLQEWAQKAKDAATEEERLAAVLEAAQEAIKLAAEQKKESEALIDEIYGDKAQGAINEFKNKAVEIAELKARLNQDEILSAEEKNAALQKLDEDYAQSKRDLFHALTTEISGYTQQMYDAVKDAADLARQNTKNESDIELAQLEEKYQNGLIAEEEYYNKQKEIKKKAAQENYKIAMFEWSASILAATANIAEGVTKAIAQGGIAGIVSGALVGAAGAVQIASIIAAKPTPPNYYQGGVIGGMNGATMGGDNTYIHARRGEMVLNASQQRALWDKLNGQAGRMDPGLNLTVNNTQAGRVDTEIQQQPNGDLILNILDKRINKGLSDGTYDPGFAAMNTRNEGVRII
jgi:hypothetical protein